MREILLYFALKYEGDFTKIYNALQKKEKVDPAIQRELNARVNSRYVTIIDDNYPPQLKTHQLSALCLVLSRRFKPA